MCDASHIAPIGSLTLAIFPLSLSPTSNVNQALDHKRREEDHGMRRRHYTLILGICSTAVLFVLTAPAHASLKGPCTASGTFREGNFNVDAKKVDEVEIPRADTVDWKAGDPGSGERVIVGSVEIEFPPPIGKIMVGEWGEDGKKAGAHNNSDSYTYDLPALIAGFDIPVSGTHQDAGFSCSGTVVVRIEGGGFSNPAALVSVAFTVLIGINMFLSLKARPI